jgi:hypothetical protein
MSNEKQEQGEPVAWMDKNKFEHLKKNNAVLTTVTSWGAFDDDVPLYTTPQPAQKPWVGLTLKEILDTYRGPDGSDYVEYARGLEAKLKEKNCAN